MCSLSDIRYLDRQGDEMAIYEVDDYGNPAYLVRTLRRLEARNLEQRFWDLWENLQAFIPFTCECGARFISWGSVMEHCDLYPCRDCQRATDKWQGWDYRCRPCDIAANPAYHERNPGYYH